MSNKEKAKKQRANTIYKKCTKCGKDRPLSSQYYMSNSDRHSDGKISVCKPCIIKDLNTRNTKNFYSEEFFRKLKNTLLEMNRPFIYDVWVESVSENKRTGKEVFGMYLKNIQLNHKEKNFLDSEHESTKDTRLSSVSNSSGNEERDKQLAELNTRNEKDVIRLLGYDPFENEQKADRVMLYNKLVDYLNEDVLEDPFKLSSVITITRTQQQIDKIDEAIAVSKSSGLSTLISAKQKLATIVTNIAKENGISSGTRSKGGAGAGTFTGIMRQLGDYDFTEANTNWFNIETAKGIHQVADISHDSISKQLSFDENNYTSMLDTQRDLIKEFESRALKAEEELRKLGVEMQELNKKAESLENEIEELKDN